MKICEIIRRWLSLPLWAYGVECEICQKTFSSAKDHYNAVVGTNKESEHMWKVPLLRK